MGAYVETIYGWGKVVAVGTRHATMTVRLFKKMPDIGRQPFPEWGAARKFERMAERHNDTRYTGRSEWDIKDASCAPG